MKIIVIGAVAAGTSAAAKARRNNKNAEIVIYEKDQDISYSGCSLPYFIGDKVKSLMAVVPRGPEFFKSKYNVDVFIRHEVLAIDISNKSIDVKNLKTGETFSDSYDKLIISTGARAFIPPIKGIDQDHVFFLRNVQDAIKIKDYIDQQKPQSAVIVGSGFIGFELLENLIERGMTGTMVERVGKLTPNLDPDMSKLLEEELDERGITYIKNATVVEVVKEGVLLEDGTLIKGEMVFIATGVKPNVDLAKKAGIFLGESGAIKVDEHMMTIYTDIYACGDCIETWNVVTKKHYYRPLGSTANKTGRICGDNVCGKNNSAYPGNLSTGIFKFLDLSIGSAGLSEGEARQQGYDVEIIIDSKMDRPVNNGGRKITIKAIADRKSQTILGVQIIGHEGVDKRLDVFVTLITYGVTVDEFFTLDLGYSPPFSNVKDSIHYIGMIFDNRFNQ